MTWSIASLALLVTATLSPPGFGYGSGTTRDLRVSALNCMQDVFDGGDLNCVAQDIKFSQVTGFTVFDDLAQPPDENGIVYGACLGADDFVNVSFTVDFECSGNAKYDIGMYVSIDGGDALSGQCDISALQAGTFGDVTVGEAETPPDNCLDITQTGVLKDYPFSPMILPCADNGCVDLEAGGETVAGCSDGLLDFDIAIGWGGKDAFDCDEDDPNSLPTPRTKSKCWYDANRRVTLNIHVPEHPTPSAQPSESLMPSLQPSESPSLAPSAAPSVSKEPTGLPSSSPSISQEPSLQPTDVPSLSSAPSLAPSGAPSSEPSDQPTISQQPSLQPSGDPSSEPSMSPTVSREPSGLPSIAPSISQEPSLQPTDVPSLSSAPSLAPSGAPSSEPSDQPTISQEPSLEPTGVPSSEPSMSPTVSWKPSGLPSVTPSISQEPSLQPSSVPTISSAPSGVPSSSPSISFAPSISHAPSEGTPRPSESPTVSFAPTGVPSVVPSISKEPSVAPTGVPSESPSAAPTGKPSLSPSDQPTGVPSESPTSKPSESPSDYPSESPSESPTGHPYYPDWIHEVQVCTNDGHDPDYMREIQRLNYLYLSKEECCHEHFWWRITQCMANEHPQYFSNGQFCDQKVLFEHWESNSPNDQWDTKLFDTLSECCNDAFWWDYEGCMAQSPKELVFQFELDIANLIEPIYCQDADIIANALEKAMNIGLGTASDANVTSIGCVTLSRNADSGNTECGGCLAGQTFTGDYDGTRTDLGDATGVITPIKVEVSAKEYGCSDAACFDALYATIVSDFTAYVEAGTLTQEIQNWARAREPVIPELYDVSVEASSLVVNTDYTNPLVTSASSDSGLEIKTTGEVAVTLDPTTLTDTAAITETATYFESAVKQWLESENLVPPGATVTITNVCGTSTTTVRRRAQSCSISYEINYFIDNDADADASVAAINTSFSTSAATQTIGDLVIASSSSSSNPAVVTALSNVVVDSFAEGTTTVTSIAKYYPDWIESKNTCVNNGRQPPFMRDNPGDYLFDTKDACCDAWFMFEPNCKATAAAAAEMKYLPDWSGKQCYGKSVSELINDDLIFAKDSVSACCKDLFGWDEQGCCTRSGGC